MIQLIYLKTDNIMTLESCLTVSITDLTKKRLFTKPNTVSVISLSKNNEQFLSLNVVFILDKRIITFTHTNDTAIDKTVTHKISIASIPSNIGDGFIKYFVCPITGKYCRKLYYHKMSFMHREATGLLYEQQTKKQPISFAGYLTTEQRNEPNKKHFKKYYKGDFTHRYFRILLRISHSEVIDAYKKGLLKRC